jgi:hypothetical protein
MLRRNEGLVGGIILLVATALAVMLSGCDESLDVTFKKRRAASFTECETYCRATPLAVKFDRNGALLECRCDIVFAEVE